jgi:CubicO group peptidase (beta-lactamase class C family)
MDRRSASPRPAAFPATLILCLVAATPCLGGEAALDQVFADWRSRHRIENAVLVVEDKSRVVFEKAYGTRRPGDRVLVGSLSKAITAACLGTLINEGRIAFDTRLDEMLPEEVTEADLAADAALRTVTVEELLTHRSGLGRAADRTFSVAQLRQLQNTRPSDVDPRLAAIETLRSPLPLESRGRYDYSTFGYVLLGQAIERVTKESYATVCARAALAPVGIKDAALDPNWGFRYAAGGWSLSGREYLAFFRQMPPSAAWLGPELARWALDGRDKETRAPAFYSLGIIVKASGDGREISHSGALAWSQRSPRNGLLQTSTQTYAARNAAGIAFFAFAEFCQPGSAGCSTEAEWSTLSRQVFEAARSR